MAGTIRVNYYGKLRFWKEIDSKFEDFVINGAKLDPREYVSVNKNEQNHTTDRQSQAERNYNENEAVIIQATRTERGAGDGEYQRRASNAPQTQAPVAYLPHPYYPYPHLIDRQRYHRHNSNVVRSPRRVRHTEHRNRDRRRSPEARRSLFKHHH